YYGTGDLVCFDFTGKKIWARNIEEDHGEFAVQFGYGSSTLLYQNKLYVLVLQRDTPLDGTPRDSYLLAIDPQTGKDLWKHIRPSDAKRESLEAYTTPIPYEGSGRKEIVIHGGDYTTGHDPATGQELWRWGAYNLRGFPHWRIVPSPVTGDGKIFVAAPKRAPLYALPGGAKGKLPYDKALWSFDDYPPDVCVPLFYQNRLFVFDGDKHVMTCLDPSNGQTMWDADLGGETVYRASPTAGDGKIYCMNEDAMVIVMDAASDTYKELGRIEMNESPSRASIAIAKNQLFIRTAQNLYCVSKQK
ncbi:PQQ-binding-like beta-propeller repeat protein, partial [bacterium]|nr:PQQ-binding-like beta-propeller repeat protein [bacterium]